MIQSKAQLIELYRKHAPSYDFTANLYYLIGFREHSYRRRAVHGLRLQPGDTVVELACGTGLNFALLEEAIGPTGRIVGVDLNDAMLAQAEKRIRREHWKNIELVHADAAAFEFPSGIDAALTTFAITLVPEFDEIIERGLEALKPGGRFAILDFKRPSWPPLWLVNLFVLATAPFGVSLDLEHRHPWESLAGRCEVFGLEDLYFGFSYLAVGQTAVPETSGGL